MTCPDGSTQVGLSATGVDFVVYLFGTHPAAQPWIWCDLVNITTWDLRYDLYKHLYMFWILGEYCLGVTYRLT